MRSDTLDVALPTAHRKLIAGRLPLFCGCWFAATVLWVSVAFSESEVTLLSALLVCGWQGLLFAITLLLARQEPPTRSVQPGAVGVCIGMALGGVAFCTQQGADAAIIAMLLYAVLMTSSILFAWRGYVALFVFGSTWGVWLLVAEPWRDLGLTLLQGAAGFVIGAGMFMVIAESAFRNLRTSVLHDLGQMAQAAALEASHASYRDLAEKATDLIWTTDLDWKLTYVNEIAARHLGLTPAAAVGFPVHSALSPHSINDRLDTFLNEIAAGRHVPTGRLQVRPGPLHPEPRWLEISATPILDPRGHIVGLRGMGRDVTERIHAEERRRDREARFRRLAESNIIGVIFGEVGGELTDANDAFLEMTGRTRADLPFAWGALTPPEWRDTDARVIDEMLTHGSCHPYEKEYFHKDGHRVPVLLGGALVAENSKLIVGFVLDLTASKRAERAVAGTLEALRASEDKLRRLAHGQAAIREEERKRLSLDLHDDVCQELVGVGILIEAVRCRLGEDAAGRAELGRAVGYMNEVVDHLRGLARELRPLPLHELGLEDALRSLAAGISSITTPVALAVPTPIPRLAEETEVGIYRVAHEAISNAVRHAKARTIALRLDTTDGQLRLQVEDDGCGFDVHGSRGTAIGLSSMEERALALGGHLTVQSEPGKGTQVTFTCDLELRKPASAA